MLHIVQVVLSGSAEAPQVFSAEEAARGAYVGCAKKYWAQAYAAFCERGGLDSSSFLSAQAFVDSFDLADKSRIHYWSMMPADGGGSLLAGAEVLQEQRERIERLARELEQASGAVREWVAGLLETIAGMAAGATAAVRSAGEPEAPAQQPLPEQYGTREWKEYVETIKNMCGGNRSEYHLFTRQDWRQAVYSDQTSFEYWEWVAATIDRHIETAQQAGYAVIPDPDQPGRYRFRTPDGVVSDIAPETEGETWCRAGLHQEGRSAG